MYPPDAFRAMYSDPLCSISTSSRASAFSLLSSVEYLNRDENRDKNVIGPYCKLCVGAFPHSPFAIPLLIHLVRILYVAPFLLRESAAEPAFHASQKRKVVRSAPLKSRSHRIISKPRYDPPAPHRTRPFFSESAFSMCSSSFCTSRISLARSIGSHDRPCSPPP